MAKRFQIVDSALVVTDTISSNVDVDVPKSDHYINSEELSKNSKVVLYDTNAVNKNASSIKTYDLAECVDGSNADTPFTEATIRDFAHVNLGFDSASGGEAVELLHEHILYNPDTNQIETDVTIQTILNSFKLGDQHRISSGGENIFFTNIGNNVNWSPIWGGLKDQQQVVNQDSTGVIQPSARIYSDFVQTNFGQTASNVNKIDYSVTFTTPSNESIFGLRVKCGMPLIEGNVVHYNIYEGNDNTGRKIYSQSITIGIGESLIDGEFLDFWFLHPSEAKINVTNHAELTVETEQNSGDSTPLSVYSTVASATNPYLELRVREFNDKDFVLGTQFVNSSQDINFSSTYPVDTNAGAVDMVVNTNIGYTSFAVFDADQNFHQNTCTVKFDNGQGDAVLQTKNDSYMFYYDGTQWRYLDLNTKNGGIV